MNRKRLVCLVLTALLALTPLAALAAETRYVKNVGSEPVGVFASLGAPDPVRALAPGEQAKWLGEEMWNGSLWYQVKGGFILAGPSVQVVTVQEELGREAHLPPAVPENTEAPQPTQPPQEEPESQPPQEEPEPQSPQEEPEPQSEPPAGEESAVSDAPQASDAPEEAGDPVAPDAADPAEQTPSQDQDQPGEPQTADEPEAAEIAEAADDPEAIEAAGTADEPEAIEAAETADEPAAPAATDDPGAPESTDRPAAPETTAPPRNEPQATPAATDGPTPTAPATPGEPSTPAPTATPTAASTATPSPRPGGASDTELVVDTAYIYPGMTKSYSNGYMPTVSKGKALFVLPLLGDVMGDVLRVTPDISTSGPFLYGNYQFDLKKSAQTAADAAGNQVSRQVFLISLSLDLAKNRYNGTYPVTFQVSYTDKNGDPAQQYFTLQVTITDGKKASSGGYSGPSAVKKPVLVLTSGENSRDLITGGEAFTLKLTVKNVGDLEAKNVRILAEAEGQGLYRSDSLAPVFLSLLEPDGSVEVSFPFASDKTVFAGRHGLGVTLSYEDKYGNVYGDTVPLQINVVQEASIGFDEMKLPETLTSGDTFTQPVCVYNTGYAPVYNVRCTLRMEGLIAASAFLGTLEPQQSADKAISAFVTTLPGKEKYGTTYGELVVSYEDMAGEEHTEYQQLRTAIQAPVEITDEEKEKQEKEQKEQQTLSQWWVSLLVSIAFILIILSVIVIARFSRMLKMK